MEDKKPVIIFKGITKLFNNATVLHQLNLEIFEKEIICLLGKSGCGKSTLLKILIGFYSPDRGFITYNGYDITENTKKIKSITGFVSQENSFYEKLTVEENLRFFAKLYNIKNKDINLRINHLLELVNLLGARKTLAEKISGGMKRRLEFAIALIHDPHILILDEPFTGLDIKIRDELWGVVKRIKGSGVTVIVSSHLLTSAQKNADRIVIMDKCKIAEDFYIQPQMRSLSSFDLEHKFLEVVR